MINMIRKRVVLKNGKNEKKENYIKQLSIIKERELYKAKINMNRLKIQYNNDKYEQIENPI